MVTQSFLGFVTSIYETLTGVIKSYKDELGQFLTSGYLKMVMQAVSRHRRLEFTGTRGKRRGGSGSGGGITQSRWTSVCLNLGSYLTPAPKTAVFVMLCHLPFSSNVARSFSVT